MVATKPLYNVNGPGLDRHSSDSSLAMAANIIRVVEGEATFRCFRTKGGGHWVAVCDPLKITVQSDTWSDLMEDIGLSLEAILKDLLSSNELGRFLKDNGWKVYGAIPSPQEDVRFDVPFVPVAMTGSHGSQTELHQ